MGNLQRLIDTTFTMADVSSSDTEVYSLNEAAEISVEAAITVGSFSAAVLASASDINATTDIFTKTSHGLVTGLVGQFTTSSALPAGISLATNYYVIYLTANTFQVATSYANAVAGTYVNFTTTGTGNQTFTPTALAGAYFVVEVSNDSAFATKYQLTNTAVLTTTGQFFRFSVLPFKYLRLRMITSSGAISGTGRVLVLGEMP